MLGVMGLNPGQVKTLFVQQCVVNLYYKELVY
jgi:hypothetical protein